MVLDTQTIPQLGLSGALCTPHPETNMELEIVYFPSPLLKTPGTLVDVFDEKLSQFLEAMAITMTINNGIGLAANQVGDPRRMFIMKDRKGKLYEFINPVILETTGTIVLDEGCLSVPGAFVQVPRAQEVYVRAQNRRGEFFEVVALDLEAVCVQHEIEHLEGKAYYERANRQQRRAVEKAISKL